MAAPSRAALLEAARRVGVGAHGTQKQLKRAVIALDVGARVTAYAVGRVDSRAPLALGLVKRERIKLRGQRQRWISKHIAGSADPIANPLFVPLKSAQVAGNFARLVDGHQAVCACVGWPQLDDGSDSPFCASIAAFVEMLERHDALPSPVFRVPFRLSDFFAEPGATHKKWVDPRIAARLLRSFFEQLRSA
jgi:RNase H-fold protein (predicted Holliday junction resolvase)